MLDVPFFVGDPTRIIYGFSSGRGASGAAQNQGLQAAFTSIFPIVSHSGNARLEFVSYALAEPAFDVQECQQRGLTFASALRAKVRLVILDRETPDTIKEVKRAKRFNTWAKSRS